MPEDERERTGRRPWGAWAVVAVVLAGAIVAYARVRWPGYLPFGSDNDEYQLVGQALASFEAPLVAGVEGTKYPLGYPALLAVVEWLRLPVAPTALGFNLAALTATTALVAWVGGRGWPAASGTGSSARIEQPGAGLAAGAVVVTSVTVWDDVFSVMPELLLLAVVAAMVATLDAPLTRRRLGLLTALAVIAVLLKALAILLIVGGLAVVALLVWRDRQQDGPDLTGELARSAVTTGAARAEPGVTVTRVLRPAGWAVLVVVAGLLATIRLPDHTTGYVATFFLEDPFDASLGRLGPLGLIGRTIEDLPNTVANFGRSLLRFEADEPVVIVIAVVGFGLGVVGAWWMHRRGPLAPFLLGALVAYTAGMALWPYRSSRFGMPLVPIAALGAAFVVRWLAERVPARQRGVQRIVGLVLGGLLLAGLVADSWTTVVERGEQAEETLERQYAALDALSAWADDHLDADEQVISFDYRELAHHLDRDIAALPYTDDTAVLDELVTAADADVVMKIDIHWARNRQLGRLVDAEPDRYEQVLDGDGYGVWRVGG